MAKFTFVDIYEGVFEIEDMFDEREDKDYAKRLKRKAYKSMDSIDLERRAQRRQDQEDYDFLADLDDRSPEEEKRYKQLRAKLSGTTWIDPDLDTSEKVKASQSNG